MNGLTVWIETVISHVVFLEWMAGIEFACLAVIAGVLWSTRR